MRAVQTILGHSDMATTQMCGAPKIEKYHNYKIEHLAL